MDLNGKIRVIVNLKNSAYFTVLCDKMELVKSKNALILDFYRFELNENTVVTISSGLVRDFEYFETVFDTETKHFTL